jgi:CBS domain-containing protein
MTRPNAHVSHPILHLEVVGPDGRAVSDYRVFCRYQQRSIAVGTCCACTHCDRITADPSPSVDCTFPMTETLATVDPSGEHTPVATLLARGTIAIDPSVTLRDALNTLRSIDRRSVAVVDASHALVGVVHEALFIPAREGPSLSPSEDVARSMSSALAIHESVSVRHALRLLASAHLREATVVDDARVPLGVFRDVDGLRFVVNARSSTAPPPSSLIEEEDEG